MKDILGAITGYLKGYWGLRWANYNIAFKLVGKTRVWPKLGQILW